MFLSNRLIDGGICVVNILARLFIVLSTGVVVSDVKLREPEERKGVWNW